MNLDVELLKAMGVPETLLTAATAPRAPHLKETRAKLDINFLDPRERALWDILCFLNGDRPTIYARKVIKLEMRRMAAEQDVKLGGMQALIANADGGDSRRARKAGKGGAWQASAAVRKR